MRPDDGERIPLKTILQNFLNHVETLETKRVEGEDLYEREFQSLKAFSDELKGKEDFSCSEGDKDVNKKKNRYKDILPFNYTRVQLSDYPGVPGSDYINANFIKGASGSNAYIASQGPLPHTVNDFWRMVVECEVQVIVMACNEQEAGKHKCENYWTHENEKEKQFGKFFITLLKSRDICPDFLVRTMRLQWTGEDGQEENRTVCQFHYSAWPDHGIPTQVKPLLEMVRLIRDCQASETLPVLIHCSAGCGRTGTICAIDYVWGLLRTGKLSSNFSLYNLVKEMRKQRIAIVQTVDQYMLCHRAVKELFLEQLRVIDSHPYENVGDDGRPLVVAGDNRGLDENPANIIPDYETIFVKGDGSGLSSEMDIDRLISQRQQVSAPRTVMGAAMLSREKSPATVQQDRNGEMANSYQEDAPLPLTLEEFSKNLKKIYDPPKGPDNPRESAPQRYKKGNLRLMQTDDGGWKLEELIEEEKRRSLETAGSNKNNNLNNNGSNNSSSSSSSNNNNTSHNNSSSSHHNSPRHGPAADRQNNNNNSSHGELYPPELGPEPEAGSVRDASSSPGNKPPQYPPSYKGVSGPESSGSGGSSRKTESGVKKKKSGGSGISDDKPESQQMMLLRKPSIKRFKALLFDSGGDKQETPSKSAEGNQSKTQEISQASTAVAKMANLELNEQAVNKFSSLPMSGSKSVPSSLDRKSKTGSGHESHGKGNDSFEGSPSKSAAKSSPTKPGTASVSQRPRSGTKETPNHPARKSPSVEKLTSGDGSGFSGVRPSLPVKRSKSMKLLSKPASVIPILNSALARGDSHHPLPHIPNFSHFYDEEPPPSPAPVEVKPAKHSLYSKFFASIGGVSAAKHASSPGHNLLDELTEGLAADGAAVAGRKNEQQDEFIDLTQKSLCTNSKATASFSPDHDSFTSCFNFPDSTDSSRQSSAKDRSAISGGGVSSAAHSRQSSADDGRKSSGAAGTACRGGGFYHFGDREAGNGVTSNSNKYVPGSRHRSFNPDHHSYVNVRREAGPDGGLQIDGSEDDLAAPTDLLNTSGGGSGRARHSRQGSGSADSIASGMSGNSASGAEGDSFLEHHMAKLMGRKISGLSVNSTSSNVNNNTSRNSIVELSGGGEDWSLEKSLSNSLTRSTRSGQPTVAPITPSKRSRSGLDLTIVSTSSGDHYSPPQFLATPGSATDPAGVMAASRPYKSAAMARGTSSTDIFTLTTGSELTPARARSGGRLSDPAVPQQQQQSSSLLDDDARRMLKDCQEYLMGAAGRGLSQTGEGQPPPTAGGGRGGLARPPGASAVSSNNSGTARTPKQKTSTGVADEASPFRKGANAASRAPTRSGEAGRPDDILTSSRDYENVDRSGGAGQFSHLNQNAQPQSSSFGKKTSPTRPQVTRTSITAINNPSTVMKTPLWTRERRNSFRQAVEDKPDQPEMSSYEPIWFREQQQQQQLQLQEAGGSADVDGGGPLYANANRKESGGSSGLLSSYSPSALEGEKRVRRAENVIGSAHPVSSHLIRNKQKPFGQLRSGSYDNLPSSQNPQIQQHGPVDTAAEPVPDVGAGATATLADNPGYEPVQFSSAGGGKMSSSVTTTGVDSSTGLASALLVAEACRDYEIHHQSGGGGGNSTTAAEPSGVAAASPQGMMPPPPGQHLPVREGPRGSHGVRIRLLHKQNSASAISASGPRAAPPPYQAPPGPPTASIGGAPSTVSSVPMSQPHTLPGAESLAHRSSVTSGGVDDPVGGVKVPQHLASPASSTSSTTSRTSTDSSYPQLDTGIQNTLVHRFPPHHPHHLHHTQSAGKLHVRPAGEGPHKSTSGHLPSTGAPPHHVIQGARTAVMVGGGSKPATTPTIAGVGSKPVVSPGSKPLGGVGPKPGPSRDLPGVDLDKVAAAMMSDRDNFAPLHPLSSSSTFSSMGQLSNSSSSNAVGQVGGGGGSRSNLGRSLAGVLSGAAANIKSRLAGMTSVPLSAAASSTPMTPASDGGGAVRHVSSPCVGLGPSAANVAAKGRKTSDNTVLRRNSDSPTLGRSSLAKWEESPKKKEHDMETDAEQTRQAGAVTAHEYGYPLRLDRRPQGPRETPGNFSKKQEYL